MKLHSSIFNGRRANGLLHKLYNMSGNVNCGYVRIRASFYCYFCCVVLIEKNAQLKFFVRCQI